MTTPPFCHLRRWRSVLAAFAATMLMSVALPLAAPSPTYAQAANGLEGTPWKLIQYAGPDGVARTVLSGTEITAVFEAGRVSGSAGCNSYSGAYTVTGTTIMISGLASTLRACADPGVMEQEGAYLAALQSAAGFEVTSDALFLRNGAGQIVLTYVPQRQTPLEGTSWIADAYNNGRGAVVSVVIGTQITAQFNAGQLSGSGGCNSYSASYSTSGNAIQIGPAASTRVFCGSPEGVMEQEAAYLAALPTAQVYRIEGNRLFLETSGGARVASYMATEPLELVGPEWAWQGTLLNDDTAFIPSDPTRYTLMFTSDGAVGVRADCNSGNGPYTVSGNQISIQILVMTSAFCPPPSLSNDFLQQLGQVATFFISDGQLVLEFPADSGAMRFTPVGGA